MEIIIDTNNNIKITQDKDDNGGCEVLLDLTIDMLVVIDLTI